MEKLTLEQKTKQMWRSLGLAVALGIAAIGLHFATKPEPVKPNWTRRLAEISAEYPTKPKHYIQRNGVHVYVAERWFEDEDPDTKKRGTVYWIDNDNNGFPELELGLTGYGAGWIKKYSNNPPMTSYGQPDLNPIEERFFDYRTK